MNKIKIICPFCDIPYTAEMSAELEGGYDCDTFECYPAEITGKLIIICDHCKKVVYEKEYEQNKRNV